MAYYMQQDLFNAIVMALALSEYVAQTSPAESRSIVDKELRGYVEFYTEDDFLGDAKDCASRTLNWLRDQNPGNDAMVLAWLAALNDAVQKYQTNGKRKPWRFLNGLYFTSARQPVQDRRIQYFKALALYFLHIQTGKIGS